MVHTSSRAQWWWRSHTEALPLSAITKRRRRRAGKRPKERRHWTALTVWKPPVVASQCDCTAAECIASTAQTTARREREEVEDIEDICTPSVAADMSRKRRRSVSVLQPMADASEEDVWSGCSGPYDSDESECSDGTDPFSFFGW